MEVQYIKEISMLTNNISVLMIILYFEQSEVAVY
jgi:hypothetical protein